MRQLWLVQCDYRSEVAALCQRLREWSDAHTQTVDIVSSENHLAPNYTSHSITHLLGVTRTIILLDAYYGLDPNILACAAACIRDGGLLLCAIPPIALWAHYESQYNTRYLSHGQAAKPESPFILRCLALLAQSSVCRTFHYQAKETNEALSSYFLEQDNSPADNTHLPSRTQQAFLDEALKLIHQNEKTGIYLHGDRGCGKSYTLTQMIRTLIKQNYQLLLCGPSKRIFNNITSHTANPNCQFYAPENLIKQITSDHIVIIDEAASLPMRFLNDIVTTSHKLVICSTTDGYEGTGRAMHLDMENKLRNHFPIYSRTYFSEPMRWSKHCKLQQLIRQICFLDCDKTTDTVNSKHDKVQIKQRDHIEDEHELNKINALLRAHHYKYTPNQMKMLLDAPDTIIFIAQYKQAVIGVLTAIKEGNFHSHEAQAVSEGNRRFRGHLVLQNLSYRHHNALPLRCRALRIHRIAVQTAWQRKGVGSKLVQALVTHYGCYYDLFCCSYSAKPETRAFWKQRGFLFNHSAQSYDTMSGRQGIVDILPLTYVGYHVHTMTQRA